MIIIKDLNDCPQKCNPWDCPCYHEGTMDHGPFCEVLVMITKDYSLARPDITRCPLVKVDTD